VRETPVGGGEVAAVTTLGPGVSGAPGSWVGDGDGDGVATAHPAVSRTNARGMADRRVQAFMALIRAASGRG
jgi:hypothetical protein